MKRLAFLSLAAMVLAGCQETTQPTDSSQPMFRHGPPSNPGQPSNPGPPVEREPPDDLGPPGDPGTPTFCVAPPSGLVSWWPLDETSGQVAGDIFGVNDGQLGSTAAADANDPSFTTAGKVDGAFSFDGVNDFIEIANSGNLNPGQVTLDAWVKPNTIKGGSRVVSKEISTTSCVAPFVVYSLDLRGFAANRADFFFTTSDNVLHELQSTSAIPTGAFSHIAATYDGSVAKMYVNGVLENSLTVSGTLRTSSAPVVIGNGGAGCRALVPTLIGFDGLIDEVEIFNRALTAQEIADIFNAGCAGKCKS